MIAINKVWRVAAKASVVGMLALCACVVPTVGVASECRPPDLGPPAAIAKDLTPEQYLALRLLARQHSKDPCFYVDAMRHFNRVTAESAERAERPPIEDDRKRAARRGSNYRDPAEVDLCPPPRRMTADGCR